MKTGRSLEACGGTVFTGFAWESKNLPFLRVLPSILGVITYYFVGFGVTGGVWGLGSEAV